MGKFKGTDLGFYVGDASGVIAGQKSFDYSLTNSYAETTSIDDGAWASYLPVGGKEFAANLDAFYIRDADSSYGPKYFLNAWFNDVSINIRYRPITGADCYITGFVWVSDFKVSGAGNTKDVISYAVSLKHGGNFKLN